MKKILTDIQSGKFTDRWMQGGQEEIKEFRAKSDAHPIEQVGADLRAKCLGFLPISWLISRKTSGFKRPPEGPIIATTCLLNCNTADVQI